MARETEWVNVRGGEHRALVHGRVLYICVGSPHIFCYSDGEYLGTEKAIFDARKRCIDGKRGDYVMTIETTEEIWKASKLKLTATWTKSSKNEWTAPPEDSETLPQRIRELDPKTYAAYRAGRYLGSEATLDLAKKRAALNAVSEKNRVMRLWEQTHPDELPPFLQLTDEERKLYWKHNPPRSAPRPATAPPRVAGGDAAPDPLKPGAVAGGPTAGQRPRSEQAAPGKAPRQPKATGDVPSGTIRVANATNPKKPGSGAAKRWDLLFAHDGKTVAEFTAAGGNTETLANAMKKGNVEVVK